MYLEKSSTKVNEILKEQIATFSIKKPLTTEFDRDEYDLADKVYQMKQIQIYQKKLLIALTIFIVIILVGASYGAYTMIRQLDFMQKLYLSNRDLTEKQHSKQGVLQNQKKVEQQNIKREILGMKNLIHKLQQSNNKLQSLTKSLNIEETSKKIFQDKVQKQLSDLNTKLTKVQSSQNLIQPLSKSVNQVQTLLKINRQELNKQINATKQKLLKLQQNTLSKAAIDGLTKTINTLDSSNKVQNQQFKKSLSQLKSNFEKVQNPQKSFHSISTVLNDGLETMNNVLSSFKQQVNKLSEKTLSLNAVVQQIDQTVEFLFKEYKSKVYQNRQSVLKQSKSNQQLTKKFNNTNFFLNLEKLNHNLPFTNQIDQANRLNQNNKTLTEDYNYYNKKYNISQVKTQQQFCIIVPSSNNAADQRYQLNLRSILNQNYTNYTVHIVDDFSSDQTYHLISRFLRKNNIPQSKVTLQKTTQRSYGLKNIVDTTKQHCKNTDIVAIIDGDDEILGANVLKVFNYFYSKSKLGTVYSNLISFEKNLKQFGLGRSMALEQNTIKNQDYRKEDLKYDHLITFRAELLLAIKEEDLKQKGQYYRYSYDYAIMLPMLEMSCKKFHYIDEPTYFYNIGTNNNVYQKKKDEQDRIAKQIKLKPKYQCHKDYV